LGPECEVVPAGGPFLQGTAAERDVTHAGGVCVERVDPGYGVAAGGEL
jgi:hypothetical protein